MVSTFAIVTALSLAYLLYESVPNVAVSLQLNATEAIPKKTVDYLSLIIIPRMIVSIICAASLHRFKNSAYGAACVMLTTAMHIIVGSQFGQLPPYVLMPILTVGMISSVFLFGLISFAVIVRWPSYQHALFNAFSVAARPIWRHFAYIITLILMLFHHTPIRPAVDMASIQGWMVAMMIPDFVEILYIILILDI